MSKKVKITKRDIKEDKFAAFVFKAKDYVQKNWYYFAGGLAVIIIAAIAVSFINSGQTKSAAKADEIFARAQNQMRSRNYQLAVVDFKEIVDDYGSSPHAQAATFYLANSLFATNNFS